MTALEFLNLDDEWRAEAVCAQIGGDIWHPEKGGSTREAKLVCNGGPGREPCPVRAECLQYALDHDERFGIWGGYSERERRALKRGAPAPREYQGSDGDKHGTLARYRRGCRCEPCKLAYNAYQREYQRAHRVRRYCETCGEEIYGKGRRRYCSKVCARPVNHAEGYPTCLSCGRKFVARADAKYCSQACKRAARVRVNGEIGCAWCGTRFTGVGAAKYCGEQCRQEARRKYMREYKQQRRRIA